MPARQFQIEKAVKTNLKARISLSAPPGSGKTTQSLIIARELVGPGGKILVIDTERRSASLYADQFDFHTVNFEAPYAPLDLAELLDSAGSQYDCIIVDSLSHFWNGPGGILEIANGVVTGWKQASPMQDRMVDAILSVPCHIICNTRAKVQTEIERSSDGKIKVRTLGMKAVQRDDIIYEFTIAASIDKETHTLNIEKSRFRDVADHKFYTFGDIATFGGLVRNWLETDDAVRANEEMLNEIGTQLDDAAAAIDSVEEVQGLSADQIEQISGLFSDMPEANQNAAKAKFTAEFGSPKALSADRFGEAFAYAQSLADDE